MQGIPGQPGNVTDALLHLQYVQAERLYTPYKGTMIPGGASTMPWLHVHGELDAIVDEEGGC